MENQQTSSLKQASLQLHSQFHGKMEIKSTVPLENPGQLAEAYTPGVGAVCEAIAAHSEAATNLTIKGNSIAVISDGSAVLGLGNIGPLASLPVLEGKAIIFKKMANLDAWPIPLNVHSSQEIIQTIKAIAPGFAGINLEDIAAPQCFEIEEGLQDLGIPVMHDDQHGTAIVVYAALLNAAQVLNKKISDLKVVINGAGAAGLATARLLLDLDQTGNEHVNDLIICDSKGIINRDRSDLNPYKSAILKFSNLDNLSGHLSTALKNADVFIGLSAPGVLTTTMIQSMNSHPIIFALANPVPEIYPDEAYAAGAAIVGTGRSDFPNQINNALVFPGIFRAAIDNKQSRITPAMKYAAAHGIAKAITQPSKEAILPTLFTPHLTDSILAEIKKSLT